MPPNDHALLSASSSKRWLACPPSARLTENYEDVSSEFAKEGTDAHELCEHKLKKLLGLPTTDPTENLTYYNEQMEECATGYASFVMEVIAQYKKPQVLIEQKLDFSKYVKDGFGTGDCVIVGDNTLHVIDYKHGQGVLVEAEKNPQMMLYALGALELYDFIYDIETVSMTIYQPRKDNISTYVMSKSELLKWAKEVVKPKADLAFKGCGEFCAGEHCRFCKAKAECKARAEYNLSLASYDFADPPLLNEVEVADILSRADALVSWVGDVKDFALSQAVNGTKYPGFKVVEGKSVRKFKDENVVAAIVQNAGYDPYVQKLKGITEMTKQLGKKMFTELLSEQVYKPQGKLTLVPDSDKRPEYSSALNDFND